MSEIANSIWLIFVEGFFLQASLILALGAQNLFVLESGLKKQHHFFVAAVCSFFDFALVTLGVLGAGTLFLSYPLLKISFGILGVSFLAYYGVLKLLEQPSSSVETHKGLVGSVMPTRTKVFGQTIAFSLLNPHVYLDTVVLIGGYSVQFPNLLERFGFGLGASLFSLMWFFALAFLASFLSRSLNNPKLMRGVFIVSGVVLLVLACRLGFDVWSWRQEVWQ